MKMQDDSNIIQTHVIEIQKELQEVRNNIQLFEKADKMKRHLDENLQELNDSFAKIEFGLI